MRKALTTAAAVIALSTAAQAADLGGYSVKDDDRDYRKPALWTGFYVGIHGGYAWGQWNGTLEFDPGTGPVPGVFDPAGRTIDGEGWLAGGQVGVNKQYGLTVVGIEVDGSWAKVDGGGSFDTVAGPPPAGVTWNINTELDALTTVRGRLGFLVKPTLLLYATGGLAIGHVTSDLTVLQCCNATGGLVTATGEAKEFHVGWVVGGGAEWALGRGWSLKAEYQYIDLGSVDYRLKGTNFITTPPSPHTTDSFADADLDMHVAKLGLNYRF
jgi:outer membrane immunogenic protein